MQGQNEAKTASEVLGRIDKQASRERTWDECGIEEKVERLRQQLRMARDMFHYTARNASDAKDLAQDHRHAPNGEVLQPVRRHGSGIESAGSSFDPLR